MISSMPAAFRGAVQVPQRLNKQRLAELAYVADALAEVLPRDQANVWMFSPNRLLEHAFADLVRDGEYQSRVGAHRRDGGGRFALCERCPDEGPSGPAYRRTRNNSDIETLLSTKTNQDSLCLAVTVV